MFIFCFFAFTVMYCVSLKHSAVAIHLISNSSSGDSFQKVAAQIYSKNMLLVRMEDGEILGEIRGDETIYPASMTKIMTTILCIEKINNPNINICVEESIFEELIKAEASMAGFSPGEVVTARDLLYGTILPSGADAAVSLTCYLAGSEESFVQLMNQKAKALGMVHTHFTNVTGLHDEEHYTTLEDLAILLEYALDNPLFYEIFTASTYTTSSTDAHPDGITLSSTLFDKLETSAISNGEILGGKTGYTPDAGLCLASLAQISGENYLLFTAGAKGNSASKPYHIIDAVNIYNHYQN